MIQLPQRSGALRSVSFDVACAKDLALIDNADAVWVIVPIHYTRWYDLATLIWWLFCPADKKATVRLQFSDGKCALVRAVRVSTHHVRLRGMMK